MQTAEQIQQQIADLIKQRDEFMAFANARVNFLNGSIEALQKVLNPTGDDAQKSGGDGAQEAPAAS